MGPAPVAVGENDGGEKAQSGQKTYGHPLNDGRSVVASLLVRGLATSSHQQKITDGNSLLFLTPTDR